MFTPRPPRRRLSPSSAGGIAAPAAPARVLAAPLALLLSACGPQGDPPAPPSGSGQRARSLVLVTLDTTRPDHLGAYGGDGAVSPAFDGLAARGVLFADCDSASPLTLPSHATLLTGLEPPAHGLRSNGRGRLPALIPTLAGVLADSGFSTGAFVSSAVLDRRHGLDRGFGAYDDEVGPEGERRGGATVERALAWWNGIKEERAFLWVHLFDPHAPYRPPEPYARLYRGRPYDGEIAYTDAVLARLLARVDPDQVLVAVVGDHGEGLGEHGEDEHGLLLHQATLAVPLVLAGPGISAGRQAAPVRTVDLFPTLLARLGVPAPPGHRPGRDLLADSGPGAGGDGSDPPPPAHGETLLPWQDYGWSPLFSLRRGALKVVQGTHAEVYDLAADPGEERDLLAGGGPLPPAVASLLEEMESRAVLLRGRIHTPPGGHPSAEPTPRTESSHLDRLRGLGYLGGGERPLVSDAAAAPVPLDPRRQVGFHRRVRESLALYRDGDLTAAAVALEELLREQPHNPFLRDLAGSIALGRGRPHEAVAHHRAALERTPDRGAVEAHLAEALLAAGQAREAEAAARSALAHLPGGSPPLRTMVVLCGSLAAQGRTREAARAAREFLERLPPGETGTSSASLVDELRRLAAPSAGDGTPLR